MAAAMIACVSAGCAKNDNKDQQSSTTSSASSKDASKTESKTESSAASKNESTEASKTESGEASKTESTEASKTESTEESKTESTEESKTESTKESTEESGEENVDPSLAAAFVGSWEFNVGSKYVAFTIYEDGSAVYVSPLGEQSPARWTVENNKLCIRAAGGLQTLEYAADKLIDVDNGNVYEKVETLSALQNSGETSDYSEYEEYFGSWEFNVGSKYVAFTIYEDGSAVYVDAMGEQAPARWTVENGKLCIRAAGGLQTLELSDGKLVDSDNGNEYEKVSTLSPLQ